ENRAISSLRSTRVACENVGDRYHRALCNLDLSELYLELNLSAEAAELSHQAHTEFEDLDMGYEKAKALTFNAIAMSQQGQSLQSLNAFRRARGMFVAEKNQVWPSLIDLYRALVLFNQGRLSQARLLASTALVFFDSSLLAGKAVLCKLLLARIAQRAGDLATARSECLSALEKLKSLQIPMVKHQAFLLIGQIHSAFGSRNDAYSCFRTARYALETLRSNVGGQELKLAFLKNRLEVYEELVDLCLRRSSQASLQEAFEYIEEAKSRVLIHQMLRPAMLENEESSQTEGARRIGNLRNELNWYYSLIELEQLRSEKRSPQRVRRLERQARVRERELVRVLRESSSTEAAQAGMPGFDRVAFESVRESIAPETLIVEYFQIGDRILACLLDRERLEIMSVGVASRLANVLRLLKFQLSKFRLGPKYAEAFRDSLIQSTRSHLKSLYDELLAPIREFLSARHLVIVPHGALNYVPFHALFDGNKYLIDDYMVSYAPSA